MSETALSRNARRRSELDRLGARVERLQLAVDDITAVAHIRVSAKLGPGEMVANFVHAVRRHEHLASPDARKGICPHEELLDDGLMFRDGDAIDMTSTITVDDVSGRVDLKIDRLDIIRGPSVFEGVGDITIERDRGYPKQPS
jgi:hypothetical protein